MTSPSGGPARALRQEPRCRGQQPGAPGVGTSRGASAGALLRVARTRGDVIDLLEYLQQHWLGIALGLLAGFGIVLYIGTRRLGGRAEGGQG